MLDIMGQTVITKVHIFMLKFQLESAFSVCQQQMIHTYIYCSYEKLAVPTKTA